MDIYRDDARSLLENPGVVEEDGVFVCRDGSIYECSEMAPVRSMPRVAPIIVAYTGCYKIKASEDEDDSVLYTLVSGEQVRLFKEKNNGSHE